MSRTRTRDPGGQRTPEPDRAANAPVDENGALYRDVVESAADLIYRLDTDGRITYANPSVSRVTGIPGTELVGKPFVDLVRPDHREQLAKVWAEVWADGGPTYCE